MKNQTESRKKEHVELVINEGAQYSKSPGFERFDFIHNALPEMAFESVDLSTKFLGKKLNWPLMIVGMTGGYSDATRINLELAKSAQETGLAFGVGSQRAMIEKPEFTKTYQVRKVAPEIPIVGNIGAVQLRNYSIKQISRMIAEIQADAIAIHLNALQEVIQPEGETDFSGVLGKITALSNELEVPVIVKETGAGINQDVAIKLKDAGVSWIDVSGAGGTSWSKVEYLRGGRVPGFENWGIPTTDAIIDCRGVLPLIASGGIRNGIDSAKAICLGAEICGAAYPFLAALEQKRLNEEIEGFTRQMQICAFLSGSKNISGLKNAKMRIL